MEQPNDLIRDGLELATIGHVLSPPVIVRDRADQILLEPDEILEILIVLVIGYLSMVVLDVLEANFLELFVPFLFKLLEFGGFVDTQEPLDADLVRVNER